MARQLWRVAGVWGGARGWNADQSGRLGSSAASTAPPAGGAGNAAGGVGPVVGTLLGPEGAGPARRPVAGVGVGCLGVRAIPVLVPLAPSGAGSGGAVRG